MSGINLPSFQFKTKTENGKNYIFDRLRKQYVRQTPEEYVRQHFINYLIEHKKYPESLLSNEVCIELGHVKKRCDTVLYDKYLKPLVIIEYKSPSIPINQEVFDQIVRYNITLQVPWLMVSNGMQHFCCQIDYQKMTYCFLKEIPEFCQLTIDN